jgi:hypothetical protein
MNKKFKERKTDFIFPPYNGYEIRIIVSNDIFKSAEKIFKKYKIKHNSSNFGGLHIWINQNPPISYIILPEKVSVGTTVHECWHAVRKMFDWIGSDYEDEIVAYTLDYLVQETFDFAYKK